ncbi:hypothetical protein B0H17DRAFT_1099545 [Mycena rosella]|uniref:Amine oxidase domain-containing protein n=1 Tax=Mycena rosella TaxID=1033263 RepID=A0AAD7CNE5_MYCRO|nr:hypothetical protein B0H17DRAFT_1099545 [Mycena rosella]
MDWSPQLFICPLSALLECQVFRGLFVGNPFGSVLSIRRLLAAHRRPHPRQACGRKTPAPRRLLLALLFPAPRVRSEMCRPKRILATEWARDELGGCASYCNFPVGSEAADEDVLAFRTGCKERRLWFCGEHAAPFEECGTVAGAYLSGQAVAERVLEVYGKK